MKLRIETPQGSREYVARPGATYVMIGSRPTDDISLPGDPAVSDPHARLEFLGKWTVADQFSATGTIHNGKKAYTADLAPGDVIQIGSARITVLELEGVAAAAPAPAPAIYTPPAAPTAADRDLETLYEAMADALRRDGDDPEKDPDERERLRNAARDAVVRDPRMAQVWISLLRNPDVNTDDVIDAITGDLDANLSDLDDDSRRVADHAIAEFQRRHGVDLHQSTLAMQRIGDAADEAVGRIREHGSADLNLPFIAAGPQGPMHLNVHVTADVLAAPAPERADVTVVPFQPMAPAARSAAPFAVCCVLIVLAVATGSGVFFFGFMRREAARREAVFERELAREKEAARAPVTATEPETAPKPAPREPRKPAGLPPERTKELEAALKTIAEGATEANAVDRLKELEAVEAECARETQHGLRWPLERARIAVEQAIMIEMQRRYGKDNGDIYHLKEKSLFREADERLKALAAHLNQTPTHTKLAKRMEMDKYLTEEPPHIARGNDDFVSKTLGTVDELLGRRQYATAAEQLGILGAQAILSEGVSKHVKAEKEHWEQLAAKQKDGGADPPIAPFDPRKNRLPPAPTNALLPKGETSTLAAQRSIDKRLEQGLKNGTIVGTATTHFGREARVEKPDDWRMKFRVKRPFAGTDGGEIGFDVRYGVNQLPARTRLGLLETLSPTRDELLALVIYAFAYGLLDDAARLACTLWKMDNAVKADLDALLAAKLRIAVPEGGFIERDGRLVPK